MTAWGWAVAVFLACCVAGVVLRWWQGRQLVRTLRLRLADVEAVQEGTTEAVTDAARDLLAVLDAIRQDAADEHEQTEERARETLRLLRALRPGEQVGNQRGHSGSTG